MISVLATSVSAYYYQQYVAESLLYQGTLAQLSNISYKASVLLDYNGKKAWFNGTIIPIGWNAYNVTTHLTGVQVNSTYYRNLRPPAHFINWINGVGTNHTGKWKNFAWLLWIYDKNQRNWTSSPTGADQYIMRNGDLISWYYEDFNIAAPPR